MSRRTDEGGSSAERSQEDFRNVQRLASKLQRMVNTGHGSTRVLRQVDQYINRYLFDEASTILGYVDSLMRRVPKIEVKEELGQIYLGMVDLLNEFKFMKDGGYQKLVKTDGSLNSQKLNNLVDLDSELTSTLLRLSDGLRKMNKRSATRAECQQLHQVVQDLYATVSARRRLIR